MNGLVPGVLSLMLLMFMAGEVSAEPDAQAPTEEDQPQPIRVMSFNIRWGGAADPPSVWPDRKQRVFDTIRAYDPDLLGVQEALLGQVRDLRDELDGYVFFGAGRDNGRLAGEMCAIYYRRDRFRRVGGGHFWLSEEPETPGTRGWGASFSRMVSWLRLRDMTDDSVWFVANTHWDHRVKKARLNSARLIRERLPELADGAPIILMGDFNCDEDSIPYSVLIDGEREDAHPLIDSYRAAHPARDEDEATYHGFQGKRKGSRIDWILHGLGIQTLAAGIDTTHEGRKYPSDHFPVTATLRRIPIETGSNQANSDNNS